MKEEVKRVCSRAKVCKVCCTAKFPHFCESFRNWWVCTDSKTKVRCIRVKK